MNNLPLLNEAGGLQGWMWRGYSPDGDGDVSLLMNQSNFHNITKP